MNNYNPSCIIEKEDIPQLKFSKQEALQTSKERHLRSFYLNRALQLGNLLKNKVKIYFKNHKDHLLQVHTTIWAVTTDFVVLKQGITIPKHRIVYID